jgi:hypothetical protein
MVSSHVGGKPMVQQQRGGAPSKPGAGGAATDMNKSGVLECKGCDEGNTPETCEVLQDTQILIRKTVGGDSLPKGRLGRREANGACQEIWLGL